jgi:hypothetical protein
VAGAAAAPLLHSLLAPTLLTWPWRLHYAADTISSSPQAHQHMPLPLPLHSAAGMTIAIDVLKAVEMLGGQATHNDLLALVKGARAEASSAACVELAQRGKLLLQAGVEAQTVADVYADLMLVSGLGLPVRAWCLCPVSTAGLGCCISALAAGCCCGRTCLHDLAPHIPCWSCLCTTPCPHPPPTHAL